MPLKFYPVFLAFAFDLLFIFGLKDIGPRLMVLIDKAQDVLFRGIARDVEQPLFDEAPLYIAIDLLKDLPRIGNGGLPFFIWGYIAIKIDMSRIVVYIG